MSRATGQLAVAVFLSLAVFAPALAAQRHYPPITSRQFARGSAQVKVIGTFTMDEQLAINTMSSIGDGEMTWLQFGVDNATQPNATITFTDFGEIGIVVARGPLQATSGVGGNEKPWCTGKVDVTAKRISGQYTCTGVTSYDQGSKKMGRVTIEIRFTAES